MSRSFLVSELVTAAKQLGDFENSSTLGSSEWLFWISASYARYHNKLVQTGMGYLEASQSITGTGVSTYSLPTDYHSSVRVDYSAGNGTWEKLEVFSVNGKHKYETNSVSRALGWRIAGANIELLPAPASGTYRHIYIPSVARITSDAGSVYFDRGFEELVIHEAVIRAKCKEETDLSDVRRERDRLADELEEVLNTLHWGESPSISDANEMPEPCESWWGTGE